jgi:predicted amidohydrolase YtcJ
MGNGMLADFTILSADVMKIHELEILNTRCLMTVIGGEIFQSSTASTLSPT